MFFFRGGSVKYCGRNGVLGPYNLQLLIKDYDFAIAAMTMDCNFYALKSRNLKKSIYNFANVPLNFILFVNLEANWRKNRILEEV